MNILIVNERFSHGGLETHIYAYYRQLKSKHRLIFAMGSFESELEFAAGDLYTGFHFSDTSSTANFIEDVENLVELIRDKQIDVIHVHPFYSIFPAVVAGQLTNCPVVYTHHGAASFSFPGRVNEALLLYYAYTELFSCVFSVSNTGKLALEERAHAANVVFLPNAIDVTSYRHHTIVNNRRWAAISRLDADVARVTSLKKLFDMLPQLPIDGVDVYGDGTQRKELETYVAQHGLADQVHFMGHYDDLYSRLNGNYNGIIGTDRAALEGLAMGYPVLELGYGRICGLLYGNIFQRSKDNNFVANSLPDLDGQSIAAQLEQVYAHPDQFDFRQEIVNSFNIESVSEKYIEQLASLSASPRANVIAWFEDVRTLPNPEEKFYASQDVLWAMRRHIEPYAIDRSMKNLFLLGSDHMDMQWENKHLQNRLLEQVQQLDQAQVQIEQAQAQIEQAQVQIGQTQVQIKQAQAQILVLEGARQQLQTRLLEQTQLLEQLQEQTEYHRKILAPLIWLRRLLSRIKWKIKSWLR